MRCKCVIHTSQHSHRHQPQLFTHSCYIQYHSPTFILTSITHSFNTFNTHLTHTLNTRLIHSFLPTNTNQPEPFKPSIDIDPISRYRSHINIDINSVSTQSLYSFVAHSFTQHTQHPHFIHNIIHINSYLINDQLIKIITVYILNHNSYLSYLLKAASITTSDSTATQGAKPDLKSTHLR